MMLLSSVADKKKNMQVGRQVDANADRIFATAGRSSVQLFPSLRTALSLFSFLRMRILLFCVLSDRSRFGSSFFLSSRNRLE